MVNRSIKVALLGLYLFALACLYSTKFLLYFNIIMIGEFMLAFVSLIVSPFKINRVVNCKCVWWLFAVFTMYNIWGYFRTTYVEYPALYIMRHLINTLTIVFLFIDSEREEIEEVFCKGSVLGSLLSIVFVGMNESDIVRQGTFERIGVSASGNVDVFGMYLGVMSIFTLYKVIVRKNKRYLFPYVLQVGFMLLTGSKQALLYIVISYIMFIKYSNKKNIAKYIIPFVLAIVAVIAVFNIPVLYNLVGHRIEIMLVSFGFNIVGVASSRSTDVRMGMISTALSLFTRNLIFGGGWGYFTVFSGFNVYSHTTYTEILVTYGLFGFFVYYSTFYISMLNFLRIKFRSPMEQLILVLLVSILAADIARITFSQTPLNYVIAFLAWKMLYTVDENTCTEKY